MNSFKSIIIISLLFFLGHPLFSQIKFQSGYIITNSGERIDCLIKNLDWKNNPTSFKYRLAGNKDILTGSLKQFRVFSITSESKYVRKTVMVDLSKTVDTNLERNKEPVFEERTIFLKVLLEGQASLYKYESGSEVRYFYESMNKPITQLIYTKYLNTNNDIKVNAAYKFQLWENLRCGDLSLNKIQNIGYKKDELVNYLKEYNNCLGVDVNDLEESKRKGANVKVNIVVGMRGSNLKIQSASPFLNNLEINNGKGYSIALVPEVFLPFNKNKWSIYSGVLARFLSGSNVFRAQSITFKYNTIEILAGLRHYFYLNDDSQLFINPIYTFGFNMNAIINFENQADLKFLTNQNLGIGVGYAFKRYSAEVRYEDCRNIYFSSNSSTCHKSLGIFLGYRL